MLFFTAYSFTADVCSFRPLLAGLSGVVTTATTLCLLLTRASNVATANSGVPINTILKDLLIAVNSYWFLWVGSHMLVFTPDMALNMPINIAKFMKKKWRKRRNTRM